MEISILNTIKSPDDVKKLDSIQREQLAEEIRYTLIDTVSKTGGHLASNLGAVELTIAIHTVFNAPGDKIVWDVGHQTYTHKLLTGRYDRFGTLRQENGLSGFPNPDESEYDVFAAGHSGASISAAYGLSVAEKKLGNYHYTVDVIGDGSFTGGLVYEALNNAGRSNTNLIVILNDNEMSISPNVGSIAKYLADIRTTPLYYEVFNFAESALTSIPKIGPKLENQAQKAKIALKNYFYGSSFFEDLGFRYLGPIDGHDMDALCEAMESAKYINYPVLIHINTVKGKGYEFAEKNPSLFHGISKFDIDTGEPISKGTNFSEEFGKYLCTLAESDRRIYAITAAMTLGTGLKEFAKKHPDRLYDVGIAEEHAMTFAGGMAKGGFIPVFAVYSTFLQRCYDEMLHDVAMQKQKVILGVDRAGFVGEDGKSHQGLFDVAFLGTVPDAKVYSPACYEELRKDLDLAVAEPKGLIAVRYPRGSEGKLPPEYKVTGNNFDIYGDACADVFIVTYGRIYKNAMKAKKHLCDKGINTAVLKLNLVVPIDGKAVESVIKSKQVFFFEEGIRDGSAGEKFGCLLLENGYAGSFKLTAVKNMFVSHATVDAQIKKFGLDAESMINTVTELN